MTIPFTKMQALGNDFIVIDATSHPFKLSKKTICSMADRHLGIGCDQLLIIEPPKQKDVDFNYRIFNADGTEVEQCGNGARCIARYIRDTGLSKKNEIIVATKSSQLRLFLKKGNQVTVDMGLPTLDPMQIPFETERQENIYNLKLDNQSVEIGAVSIGNPHAVLLVTDADQAPVVSLGAKIEQHPQFSKHTNVEFMEIINPTQIRLRVFERGVGETLACGSGACAAVVIGRIWGRLKEKVTVELPGGKLIIRWRGSNHPILMTGPAEWVFTGEWLND